MLAGAFDGEIIRHFNDTVGIYPIGSVVMLASRRLAMVVGQDPSDALRPLVRTFWSADTCRGMPPTDIALAQCYGEDSIQGTVDPSDYGCDDFVTLRERLFSGGAGSQELF
jgi:hypothetical protein